MSEPLRMTLGAHPIGDLLRSGVVNDPELTLDHVETSPIHHAFAPMVRTQAYDVSELAIVTALQAVAYGRPVVILPVAVAARFQRGCLVAPRDRPVTDPAQLAGGRIGVRAYTQTTGMWVRSHLAEDFGLQADGVTWVTQDPAHVEEYVDPSYVNRDLTGSLVDAMRSGAVDAAIFGNDLPTGEEFVPVFDHAAERDRAWYDKHGYAPINHMVAVSADLLERDPDAVRRVYHVLQRAEAEATPAGTEPRLTRAGLDQLSGPIEEIATSCLAQGLIPRPLTAADVFGPVQQILAH